MKEYILCTVFYVEEICYNGRRAFYLLNSVLGQYTVPGRTQIRKGGLIIGQCRKSEFSSR
jgi:hypothetical protein